jgi:predicted ATPase
MIDLGPLGRNEALQFASTFFDAVSTTAERCVERAAGNPLFLEQLLRHAEEMVEDLVPDSVQSLVQARMDRLDPSNKQALQTASVFGQWFSLDGLRHLIGNATYDCSDLVIYALVQPQGEEFSSRRRCPTSTN